MAQSAGTALFADAGDLRYHPLSGWQGDLRARPTVVV